MKNRAHKFLWSYQLRAAHAHRLALYIFQSKKIDLRTKKISLLAKKFNLASPHPEEKWWSHF